MLRAIVTLGRDSALIEDLNGARMQAAGAQSDKVMAGAPLFWHIQACTRLRC